VIGSALFPERQTGAEFLGGWDASTQNTIGYHFTLSNGLGPISEIKDLDGNKGVGGRVFWENRALGALKIGGSIFYAKDTSAVNVASLSSTGRIDYNEKVDAQSKVLSMAADVQWHWKGLHVQAEVITQQRKFNESARVAGINPFTGQPIFPTDYTTWGAYGLVGYGYDVRNINLMPYFMVSSFDQITTNYIGLKTNGITAGLNVRPLDSLVVKFAYLYSAWPDGNLISDDPIHIIQSQIAWAF